MIRLVHEEVQADGQGLRIGENDWYEPFTQDKGELFRACQYAYGRCTSKVYHDVAVAFHPAVVKQSGWVFIKRKKYSDSPDTYLHRTWVIWKGGDEDGTPEG